jgi:hypothetical protein
MSSRCKSSSADSVAAPVPDPITEKRLRFVFDATWDLAFKWDDSSEFLEGLEPRGETRAMDIVGTRRADELWMIEVKDARGFQVEDRNRRTETFDEITRTKVRDTVAGLVWSLQRFKPDRCQRLARVLFAKKKSDSGRVVVVLWCEGIDVATAEVFQARITAALKWLNASVLVTDRRLWPQAPREVRDALDVESLSGAAPIASK